MKISDELFRLIKTLSKSEKRFFKLFASQTEGSKNYILLFEAMDDQENYDETKIKKKFRAKAFIKHLPSEKNYLQKMILRALRIYHADRTPELEANSLLLETEVLYMKKLSSACLTVIKKGKALALQNDLFLQYLSFTKWEYRVAVRTGDFKFLEGYGSLQLKEEMEAMENYRQILELRSVHSFLFANKHIKGIVAKKEDRNMLDDIIKPYLSKEPEDWESFTAKIVWLEVCGYYYLQKNDYANAYRISEMMVKLYEDHPEKINLSPVSYAAVISNLTNRGITLKKYAEVEKVLEKLDTLQPYMRNNETLKIDIYMTRYERLLQVYCFTRQLEKAEALVSEIGKFSEEYRERIRKDFFIFFNYFAAVCALHSGKPKSALKHANFVLNDESRLRPDLVLSAQLLNMAIHYKLQNNDMIPYLLQSLRRYLDKNKSPYQFPRVTASFFSAIGAAAPGTKKFSNAVNKLKQSLAPLTHDPVEKELMVNFDVVDWAMSLEKKRAV